MIDLDGLLNTWDNDQSAKHVHDWLLIGLPNKWDKDQKIINFLLVYQTVWTWLVICDEDHKHIYIWSDPNRSQCVCYTITQLIPILLLLPWLKSPLN